MIAPLSFLQPTRLFHVLQHAVNYVSDRLEGIGSLFGNELSISRQHDYEGHSVTTFRCPDHDSEQVRRERKAFPESGKIDDEPYVN